MVLCALIVIAPTFYDFSEKKEEMVSSPAVAELAVSGTEDDEAIRLEFKELFKQYANEFEPDLGKYNLLFVSESGLAELTSTREAMNLSVAQGNYHTALNHLQNLQNQTKLLLEQAEQSYANTLDKAKNFYSEDKFDEAKQQIDFALQLMPESAEVLVLQEQNEKLSTLLPYLENIGVARAEKDMQKEYDLLQQLLSLAPERTEELQRSKTLAQLIKESTFNEEVGAGFAAFDKGDIQKAKEHYRKAKHVAPERDELKVLGGRIGSYERTVRVRNNISLAEQAIRRDDWKQAQNYYSKAAKDDGDNQKIVEGQRQATRVLTIGERLQLYMNNPYRLTNPAVHQEAERVVEEAQSVTSLSFSVKRKVDELTGLLLEINRPVSVTIVSDNKTNVLVRGVGKVGRVHQKTIELKPGKYTLEGIRKGYKSKLVTVQLPLTQKDYSVRMICDEPI